MPKTRAIRICRGSPIFFFFILFTSLQISSFSSEADSMTFRIDGYIIPNRRIEVKCICAICENTVIFVKKLLKYCTEFAKIWKRHQNVQAPPLQDAAHQAKERPGSCLPALAQAADDFAVDSRLGRQGKGFLGARRLALE